MSDIFISYSRKDAEQVMALADRLRANGASVWMDTAALAAAETWSAEIVTAIEECTYFIVMLSPHSVASANVTKEVSLASESKKTIIPIEIVRCELNPAMKYALAGLQKVKLHDEVALHRSLSKLGLAPGGNAAPTASHASASPTRTDSGPKRLAVLPFEDLSPQHDNEWFSDGLTNELISMLTRLPELYIIDKQTSKMYKGAKLSSKQIAAELNVRYLVTGEVRKAGEKIRIQAALLDTADGRTLWDEKFNGTMDDIFEIQDKTALDIAAGLKLRLTPEQEQALESAITRSSEAYELYLRAEYLGKIGTLESALEALNTAEQALQHDPNFAEAYLLQAFQHRFLYKVYGQDPQHLVEAQRVVNKALEAKPHLPAAQRQLAWLLYSLKRYDEAELLLLECFHKDPNEFGNLESLADFYYWQKQPQKAIYFYEKAHACNPDAMNPVHMLCQIFQFDETTSKELKHWAQIGVPLSQRLAKNEPNNEDAQLQHVFILIWDGQIEEARRFLDQMTPLRDARSMFNKGIVYMHLRDGQAAAVEFLKALNNGFTWFEGFNSEEFDGETFAEVRATVARKKDELALSTATNDQGSAD